MFKANIRSRHKTHSIIRGELMLPFRSIVRFGSSTKVEEVYKKSLKKINLNNIIECNTVEAVKNSSSKLLMKQCFDKAGVKTAKWLASGTADKLGADLGYPIVAKSHFGSRGLGNHIIREKKELVTWLANHEIGHYIFESYYPYSREYRIHVSADGCFYTCRKVLKKDTPEGKRWYRNDSNCAWILEENPLFEKPSNWDEIVAESIKALKAVGLDVGAIDVRVQSARNADGEVRKKPDFIILETNSAPSFGTITSEKYRVEIPKILKRKYESR